MHRRDFIKAGITLSAMAFAPHIALSAVKERDALVTRAQAAIEKHRVSLLYTDVVGLADFSRHCSKPRFHLVDMEKKAVDTFLVAHGEGSDPDETGWLEIFSNQPRSRATSRGSYLTRNYYEGELGPARRLTGLDPDNDKAYDRAIVIHGSDYVSEDHARSGMIGTSWGCFAFSRADIGTILERLGPGRLLHAFK